MARSEYVKQRLAELGVRPKGGAARIEKPRTRYTNPSAHEIPWKPHDVSEAALLYVRVVRRSAPMQATWFDVARAFDAGRATVGKTNAP